MKRLSRQWQLTVDHAPKTKGAYAVLMTLPRSVELPPTFSGKLRRGRYIYLGSARGSGGIRARLGRHLSLEHKPKHWHVDWLTEDASKRKGLWFLDQTECDLTTKLLNAGLQAPVIGFGSSDCPTCPSHLLAVPPDLSEAGLSRILAD